MPFEKQESEAVTYHQHVAPEAVRVWGAGTACLEENLAVFQGTKIQDDAHRIQLAILFQATQHETIANRLALWGYYAQALNLFRLPLESAVAYFYLNIRPAEHPRFTRTSQSTPLWNDMIQAIEGRRGTGQDKVMRDWIKDLHHVAHVDRLGIRMTITGDASATNFLLGPDQNELLFGMCAEEGLRSIDFLLVAIENCQTKSGLLPTASVAKFKKDARDWYATTAAKFQADGAQSV
jgi:hypothetical protein